MCELSEGERAVVVDVQSSVGRVLKNPGRRPTVAIIGSFRQHYGVAVNAARVLQAGGIVVSTPAVSQIINPGADYVRFELDSPEESDEHIQAATQEKIFAADVVYVVAPGGYIGRTTSYELGQVHDRGMQVFYSERIKDLPIAVPNGRIVDVHSLVDLLNSVPGLVQL